MNHALDTTAPAIVCVFSLCFTSHLHLQLLLEHTTEAVVVVALFSLLLLFLYIASLEIVSEKVSILFIEASLRRSTFYQFGNSQFVDID